MTKASIIGVHPLMLDSIVLLIAATDHLLPNLAKFVENGNPQRFNDCFSNAAPSERSKLTESGIFFSIQSDMNSMTSFN